jgi:hypothetical protein
MLTCVGNWCIKGRVTYKSDIKTYQRSGQAGRMFFVCSLSISLLFMRSSAFISSFFFFCGTHIFAGKGN